MSTATLVIFGYSIIAGEFTYRKVEVEFINIVVCVRAKQLIAKQEFPTLKKFYSRCKRK